MTRTALTIIAGLAAMPAAADVFLFQTPSGNIQCSGGEDFGGVSDVMCTILQRQGPPALPDRLGCGGGWGHHFVLTARGPAQLECRPVPGKTDTSGIEVAPYGVTGRWGDITCLSERTGLTCRNSDGHGFFLSRAKQSVF